MHYPMSGLSNLVCIIDWNKAQNDGYSDEFSIMYDNLKERITSFGWDTKLIDGHNMDLIRSTLATKEHDQPLCIILDTVKGKGVSFMEDPSWHCKVPTEEEYEIAIKELGV